MTYELMYLISADVTEDGVGRVEGTVSGILEKDGATIDSATRLGKFRLAYPIKGARYGHYQLVRFTCEPSVVIKIDEHLRITGDVIRHMILRADEVGDDKYEFVQFVEVDLNNKESSDRRKREPSDEKKSEVKAAVEAIEGAKADETAPVVNMEELEKKIDSALQENS